MTFAEFFNEYCNYMECKTDFVSVFSDADMSGIDAIKESYAKAISECLKDAGLLAELAMVTNLESAYWFQVDIEYSSLYGTLYDDVCEKAYNILTGHELVDFEYYVAM